MSIISVTSREFNQHASRAKRKALEAPVFITDRGRPSHVLLSIDEYQRLTHKSAQENIADLLAMPGSENIEIPIPRRQDKGAAADLG